MALSRRHSPLRFILGCARLYCHHDVHTICGTGTSTHCSSIVPNRTSETQAGLPLRRRTSMARSRQQCAVGISKPHSSGTGWIAFAMFHICGSVVSTTCSLIRSWMRPCGARWVTPSKLCGIGTSAGCSSVVCSSDLVHEKDILLNDSLMSPTGQSRVFCLDRARSAVRTAQEERA